MPQRLAFALPMAGVTVALIALGGWAFVIGVALVGAFAVREAYALLSAPGVLGASRLAAGVAALLALAWVAIGLGHGVALRELDHGGALVLDVLLAVFVGDTAAQIVGSLLGRRSLAPSISPRKTVEGLIAGIVVGTCAATVGSAFQDSISLGEGAVLGLCVSLAAPLGDLFESAIKRRAGVKDSGTLLGPHGGVLDRTDAVLFAAVAGFYAALALL